MEMFGLLNKRIQRHEQQYITRELGVPLEIDEVYWQLHYILFAVLFSIVSFFILRSILGLIQDDRQKKFQRRHFFLWMNLALLYFSGVMTVALFADPYEDRRYIKPTIAREALHLVIRLRLPCLGFAFSLLQLSLFNVTEIVLYATWFHNLAIILIVNLVHACLVIIASISSMFTDNGMIVWLVSDLCMFLLFSGNSIVTLYSVTRILLYYHRSENSRCRSVSNTNCMCPRRTTFGEEDYMNEPKIDAKPPELGEDNTVYESSEAEEKQSNSTEATDVTVASEINEDNTHTTNKHESATNKYSEKSSISGYSTNSKSSSLYNNGCTDRKKIVCQKRRIGSLPHRIHASKFSDKSIRKVACLMMVVAVAGLLMCVTIVISLSSARLFQGDHIGPWEWYALRTVRRTAEIVCAGTIAYLIRRTFMCC